MIKSTVGDLLDGKLRAGDCRLYVVRDDKDVLYVGRSRDPVERILGHTGKGSYVFGGPSAFGMALLKRLPESRSWIVELYRPDEVLPNCKPIIDDITKDANWPTLSKTLYDEPPEPELRWRDWDVKTAEEVLIDTLEPVFNVMGNKATRGRAWLAKLEGPVVVD